MDKRIIYQEPGQAAAIITPLDCGLTLQQIADKDVPTGQDYWVVELYDVQTLYNQYGQVRDAWDVNAASMGRPADGVGQ